jgi:Flp pilus assembly protein TadD
LHRASIVASSVVVLTLLTAGCASKAVSPASGTAGSANAAGSTMSPAAKTGSAVGGFFQATTATVTKSTKAMTAAFTPKPKEPASNDPVSLNTKSKPAGPDLYLSAARMREAQGDLQGAAAEYDKGLKAAPGDLQLLLGYGHLHDRQGKLVEATRLYQEAVTRHPKDAAAQNDLGLCFARRGMLDQASAALIKATELQPDRKLYRNNLATVKVEQGRIDDAYAQLAAVNPPATAHYNLGYLLVQKGDQPAAVTQFNQALMADPNLADAQKWLVKLGASNPALVTSRRTAAAPTTTQQVMPTTPVTPITPVTQTRMAEAPLPSAKPEYLQPQASNFQVRYPQPSAEPKSADDGGIPPSPDRYDSNKPAEPTNPDSLRLLPPVNSAYFAPSRY